MTGEVIKVGNSPKLLCLGKDRRQKKGEFAYYKPVHEPDAIRFLHRTREVEQKDLSSSTASGWNKIVEEVKKWLGL